MHGEAHRNSMFKETQREKTLQVSWKLEYTGMSLTGETIENFY
jgi:hypothetical protein